MRFDHEANSSSCPSRFFFSTKRFTAPPPHVFICLRDCLSKSCVYVSRSRVHSTGEPCLRIHSWGQKHIVTAAQFVPLLIAFCPELQRGHEPLPQPPYIHPPPPPPKKKKRRKKEEETHESCGNRGGRCNSPYGFGGRKATLNLNCQKVVVIDVCCCF